MRTRLVYPSLPAILDLGLLRIGGWGLGNCLFVYFHAFVQARSAGRGMIVPAWYNFQIGPWLRGEHSLRRYGRMIRRHPDEVGGVRKALALARALASGAWKPWARAPELDPGDAAVAVFAARRFTFAGLYDHRAAIRDRLLAIASPPGGDCTTPSWGEGGYAAIHVRLGDFAAATPEQLRSGAHNLRIPQSWYRHVAGRLRQLAPKLPIRVYSDGTEAELADLLAVEGVDLHREATDIGDLLALSGARVLVGSHSTFSQWAAFLGDMPTIWFANNATIGPFGSPITPMLRIDSDLSPLDTLDLQ